MLNQNRFIDATVHVKYNILDQKLTNGTLTTLSKIYSNLPKCELGVYIVKINTSKEISMKNNYTVKKLKFYLYSILNYKEKMMKKIITLVAIAFFSLNAAAQEAKLLQKKLKESCCAQKRQMKNNDCYRNFKM
jgi:hypothetical protein